MPGGRPALLTNFAFLCSNLAVPRLHSHEERVFTVAIGFRMHQRPHLRELLRGIQRFARSRPDWRLKMLYGLGFESAIELGGELDRDFDGLITGVQPESRDAVARIGRPAVVVGPGGEGLPHPWVGLDTQAAADRAAAHLFGRGWRRVVAFSHGDPGRADAQRFRAGYEAAAARAGRRAEVFTVGPRTRARGRWTLADQIADLTDCLMACDLPVGVVAGDEEHARRALHAAEAAGWSVPEQVSVICLGTDTQLAELTDPALSTVPIDHAAVGAAAGALLDRHLRGERVARRTLIPPGRVVERASSGVAAFDDPDVAAALRFIEDHVDEPIRIHDVAEAVLVSPRTLSRKFASSLRQTPGEAIRGARVRFAERLLLETDRPLADIATACGMGLPSQFGRDFKRATGMTPSAFRELHQR